MFLVFDDDFWILDSAFGRNWFVTGSGWKLRWMKRMMMMMMWSWMTGLQCLVGEDEDRGRTDKMKSRQMNSHEDRRVLHEKVVREDFKIILQFRKEDEQVSLGLRALSRELNKKLGEEEMAQIFVMETC